MTDNKMAAERQIAMLIDGDNAQPSLISKMLAETGKYGITTIRRVFGDWTTANMGGWKEVLQSNAIQPIQQFRYSVGKNATDSAMIIDAMDILYSGSVEGFCLVSSDSDYTRLATRLRESGLFVIGIGKKLTPRAFVNGCNVFVFTENLVNDMPARPKPQPTTTRRTSTKQSQQVQQIPEPVVVVEPGAPDPIPLLKNGLDIAMQDDGWAFLGTLGNHLRQLDPSFDSRTYGFKQLSVMIRAFPKVFELREVKSQDGTAVIYVRLKE
jgi:hypothetical protein